MQVKLSLVVLTRAMIWIGDPERGEGHGPFEPVTYGQQFVKFPAQFFLEVAHDLD